MGLTMSDEQEREDREFASCLGPEYATEHRLFRAHAELDALRARAAELERERDEAREIIGEYLNPICEAFERVKKIERHPPGSGISDPDYPGPTNDEIEQYDDEIMSARNDLTEAIQVACDAQEGE